MIHPDSLAVINPTSGLAPNETVCPTHHLTYHQPLGECPECRDERT